MSFPLGTTVGPNICMIKFNIEFVVEFIFWVDTPPHELAKFHL